MLRAAVAAAVAAVALGACPNQCSGHGRCSENDKCVCFRQQGLYSPYRYGYTGADCSQRTCPLGRAYDVVTSSAPSVSPIVFKSATGASHAKLSAVFVQSSQDAKYQAMRSDKKIIVKIMTVTSPIQKPYGTFAWRFEEDGYFSPEQPIGDYASAMAGFAIASDDAGSSGVYVYFDPTKGATASFKDATAGVGEIAPGDVYEFALSWNEGQAFNGGDSNSVHQLVECSGRGICDSETGKCNCLPGYTGEACQRTACPNQCSGHGSCQTQHRFASDGLSANTLAYTSYDREQQYGCKCDKGYRGPDCSQVECPSGPDVLGADGGAEGMDCSGRGLCDYGTGVCKCFRGFFGERCEQQSTLV